MISAHRASEVFYIIAIVFKEFRVEKLLNSILQISFSEAHLLSSISSSVANSPFDFCKAQKFKRLPACGGAIFKGLTPNFVFN